MSEKHTPAPWEWVGNDLEHRADDWNDVIHTEVSCGAFCYGGSIVLKISEADKRLIAAAPDLLESLEQMLRLATRNDIPEAEQLEIADRALTVIQKARGAA